MAVLRRWNDPAAGVGQVSYAFCQYERKRDRGREDEQVEKCQLASLPLNASADNRSMYSVVGGTRQSSSWFLFEILFIVHIVRRLHAVNSNSTDCGSAAKTPVLDFFLASNAKRPFTVVSTMPFRSFLPLLHPTSVVRSDCAAADSTS